MKMGFAAGLLFCFACETERAPKPELPDSATVTSAAPTAAPAPQAAPGLSVESVQGAWGRQGESFAWSIEGDSILFESDMMRYPFEVRGDTLIIERDSSIGIQKTRVLLLTADSMIIQDVLSESAETLFRLR
jgi:hypothetical protein